MKQVALVWTLLLTFARFAGAAPPPPKPLTLSLPYEGPVALAVLDARPDILSGDHKESFVGVRRSLYGIPYPSHTPTKKPFAQEISGLVSRALQLGGGTPRIIDTSPHDGRRGAVKALQASGADRLLLLEIRDWWSDTLVRTDLHYDLTLTVLNAQGQELGSSSAKGHDEIGKRERPERRDVPSAKNDILASLFAADTVLASFSSDASPQAQEVSCSVEQILKMKEAGLTQSQIEAACGSGS